MAETRPPQRLDYPSPSMSTGDLYNYLLRTAVALNEIPSVSYCSGNPNSTLTANIGTLAVNIGSAASARLWIKIYGSSNTGWASAATA